LSISTAEYDGAVFDQPDKLLDRLRQGPGEEARREVAPQPDQLAPPPSRWTLRTIRVSVPALRDYSLSGVWRVLRRCECQLRSPKVRQFSPDPEYLSKEASLLGCLQRVAQAPEKRVLLFLDEMGYQRWPEAAENWGPTDPALQEELECAGNNTQWRIVGALNALTGQVDYLDNYIVGRKQLISFYGRLSQRYADVEQILVAQDNWSIHQHPDVVTALSRWPRIEPIWLPTYAPWLNPIEKLWRLMRQDVLKVHRLAGDWPALRQRVRTFLDQFASGSHAVLRYVGLLGEGKLAQAIYGS
jgi:transposase